MNDFDFFTGTWNVRNRWRTDFLDETSEWEEFPGVSQASRHFGGAAHFDEIDFPTKGFSGLTLRLYDPERAPADVVAGIEARQQTARADLERIRAALAALPER